MIAAEQFSSDPQAVERPTRLDCEEGKYQPPRQTGPSQARSISAVSPLADERDKQLKDADAASNVIRRGRRPSSVAALSSSWTMAWVTDGPLHP